MKEAVKSVHLFLFHYLVINILLNRREEQSRRVKNRDHFFIKRELISLCVNRIHLYSRILALYPPVV